ncbi:MAG: response regulator transcription factor [Acidimicrobiia bacterium]
MTLIDERLSGRVVVVDDEPMVREVVTRYLQLDGHEIIAAADGTTALEEVRRQAPDLVVLDLMLPGLHGLEVLAALRENSEIPVILLTASGDEADRVAGLELGADDYVVKPFSPRELAARVRSVLRRTAPRPPAPTMSFDDLIIDTTSRCVTVADEAIELARREFDLLAFLADSPGQVFSRGQLLDHVWGSSAEWQDPSTVTVHVRRLRAKLEPDPQQPRWISTVRGVGYRFSP